MPVQLTCDNNVLEQLRQLSNDLNPLDPSRIIQWQPSTAVFGGGRATGPPSLESGERSAVQHLQQGPCAGRRDVSPKPHGQSSLKHSGRVEPLLAHVCGRAGRDHCCQRVCPEQLGTRGAFCALYAPWFILCGHGNLINKHIPRFSRCMRHGSFYVIMGI